MRTFILAATTALAISGMAAQEKYEYNEFYYQRSTLFAELPVKSGDIVFLGDSQTNGCEWHEMLDRPNVKNRGISSDVIQGFADRVDAIVAGRPAKIFILGGVNDRQHCYGNGESYCENQEEFPIDPYLSAEFAAN